MARTAARKTRKPTTAAPTNPPESAQNNDIFGAYGDAIDGQELVSNVDLNDHDLIRTTLKEIMRDPGAPAAAKAQAARTLAEMVGALGRHAPPPTQADKPLTEMTREELEKELLRS